MKRQKDLVLVTGAGGFVGSYVTQSIVNLGYDVHIISKGKATPFRIKHLQQKLILHTQDIRKKTVISLVNKINPSHIFHFAAYGTRPGQTDIRTQIGVNILGTQNLLMAAREIPLKLFICAGSSSEYGVKNHPMKETDILEPIDTYGITKAAATHLCMKYAHRENVPVSVFRLFSPYGDNEDEGRFVPYIIRQALAHAPMHLSNPNYVRDFTYIEDIGCAYVMAMHGAKNIREQIVNIAEGQEASLGQVVDMVVKLTKSKSVIHWNTHDKDRFVKEPLHWEASIAKAKKLLNWTPEFTLEEGIKKTIQWFVKHR